MHLGIDARALCGRLAGIGHYVQEVVSRLDVERITLYCAPDIPAIPLRPDWAIHTSRLPRLIALKAAFTTQIMRDQLDVFWAAQTLLPPFLGPVPTVSTVYDLNHLIVPRTMSWGTRLAHSLWFDADVRAADILVAISSGTAGRVQETYYRTATVARPGVSTAFHTRPEQEQAHLRKVLGLPHEFLLAVSTLEPRKNTALLVEAHDQLYARGAAPPLVLVGQAGWGTSAHQFQRSGTKLLGYVDRDHLPGLYSAARAFLMPSLYEGFGMPAAEARACGCNVVATDIPELREACGNRGIFIDPTMDGIIAGIQDVLEMPPEAPSQPSSWDDTAAVYMQAFKDAISGQSGRRRNRL